MHLAVDTLGHLLALHVTPANEQDREQVVELTQTVQEVTGGTVDVAFVDQGYTGESAQTQAQDYGMELVVVKHTEAKKGFILFFCPGVGWLNLNPVITRFQPASVCCFDAGD